MNATTTSPDPAPEIPARLTRLEEVVTHLERTTNDLDQSVRLLFKRLNTVERSAEQMLAGLDAVAQAMGRRPDKEKE